MKNEKNGWFGCAPTGCLLSPSPEAAVVGGNVLTSQRVTDVVLKAFNAAAASQVGALVWESALCNRRECTGEGATQAAPLLSGCLSSSPPLLPPPGLHEQLHFWR